MNSQYPNETTAVVALIAENDAKTYHEIRRRYRLGATVDQLSSELKAQAVPLSHTDIGSQIINQLYGNIDWGAVVQQIVLD